MSIPLHQLGWMAGVLDMKGLILAKNNQQRATQQLVLAVETKQIPVIRELARMTGTSPEPQAAKAIKDFMRRGCVEHCPDHHQHVVPETLMPATSRWTVTGVSLAVVLHGCMPFIRNQERGFMEAMNNAFTDIPPSGQGRGAVDKAINRLRELEWDIPDLCFPAEKSSLKLVKNAAS